MILISLCPLPIASLHPCLACLRVEVWLGWRLRCGGAFASGEDVKGGICQHHNRYQWKHRAGLLSNFCLGEIQWLGEFRWRVDDEESPRSKDDWNFLFDVEKSAKAKKRTQTKPAHHATGMFLLNT